MRALSMERRCPAQQVGHHAISTSTSRARPCAVHANAASSSGDLPGPRNAFVAGQEANSRRQLFNRISPVYDKLNNQLSLGQHVVWKNITVKWSGAKPGHRALDVCCGSGDLAFMLSNAVGPKGQVVGLDFAAEMLQDAAQRQQQRVREVPGRRHAPINWVQGDAMALPFGPGEFDAVTMGYGLRNVADIPKALRELARVLRPGGKAAVLDFNNSSQPLVDALQGWVLENVVVPTAAGYGLEDEYRYLRPSIQRFPQGDEQEQLALAAGFSKAKHYELGFGLMGVLVATK